MPEERKPVQTIPELLVRQFETARKFTLRLTGEFDEETALWRPTEFNNNALWIAGHILCSSDYFAGEVHMPKRTFGPEMCDDFSIGGCYYLDKDYPLFKEIADALAEDIVRWREFLASLALEDLARPTANPNDFLPTVGEAASFVSAHELLHAGQLFYVRRGLGKEPLI